MMPEIVKADVLSDGGIPGFWCLPVGLRAGLGGSFIRCAAVKGVVPILEMMFMILFGSHR